MIAESHGVEPGYLQTCRYGSPKISSCPSESQLCPHHSKSEFSHGLGPDRISSFRTYQCRIGRLVGNACRICRRARAQDSTASCISCSADRVSSRRWLRVVAISTAAAGFVRSSANSRAASSIMRICASFSSDLWARSGNSRLSRSPNSPSTNPSSSSRRHRARCPNPSRFAGTSIRVSRNGAERS
jgi:hypothetical protein